MHYEYFPVLSQCSDQVNNQGRRAVVRNGYLPEREVLTGGVCQHRCRLDLRSLI